ncbi:MAG: 2-phosphosulfolactate phosphatase [candidate division NC10 bacterium]|nr:2-phosphosulfolactate phosphatase [candidate division NC10 bacterium]
MRVDVLLLPRELAVRPRPDLYAVVVDVLRATTSIVVAFQHGCRSILPVASAEEAERARAAAPGALLAGEQGGQRIPGFDLGNSPREFSREVVGGREVILTTSNGTKTLRAVGGGRTVAIGAFQNRSAVGDWLVARGADSLIVCSGYEGGFSLEDAVCAGAIVDRVTHVVAGIGLGDGARASQALWERFGSDLPRLLPNTAWGQRMVAMGFGPDMEACARVDVTDVVPVMEGGRIALGEPRA